MYVYIYIAALETMIKLSNYIGADPYFNIPHLATDDYIRNFALLIKSKLRPDLRIFIGISKYFTYFSF